MQQEYNINGDARQDSKVKQTEKLSEAQRQQSLEFQPALVNAAAKLQSGAKLLDLSPEETREFASAVGNQTMLQLLRGGGAVPLAPTPPGPGNEASLPETEVRIRWPALSAPLNFARDGPLPGSVFPVSCLRPMGRGGEVVPDG